MASLPDHAAGQCVLATEIAKLLPKDGASFDHFGYSVAIAADTTVVGVPGKSTPGGSDAGSAYVFVRSGTVWTLQAQLTASDGAANDEFGTSVAISGDTVIVGSVDDDTPAGSNTGSAYVFTRSTGVWTQQAKLTAADGATFDQYGVSVAVSSDTAVVGAWADDDTGSASGSAYVYTRSGTVWTLQQKVTAIDAAAGDQFGYSVALEGSTLVVGADKEDNGGGSDAGAVYVFTRSGTVWSQQQKLTASDGASFDGFGAAVAISGETVAIGAWGDDDVAGNAGSGYVFTRAATVWSQQQKVTAFDGTQYDRFGRSVGISGDTAVFGADDGGINTGTTAGATYVFTRSAGVWTLQQKVTPPDGLAQDWFGSAVAISGETIVSGARFHDTPDGTEAGAAYVFARAGSVWTHEWTLAPSSVAAGDEAGIAVAISGDTAVVGAYLAETSAGENAGAAHVYVRTGSVWRLQDRLTAPDGAAEDWFGESVAISGDTIVVGAYRHDEVGSNDGAAYVFVRTGSAWAFQAKLLPTDGLPVGFFGSSVAIEGNTAIIGGGGQVATGLNGGSAFVFIRTGTVWTQQARLKASDEGPVDFFGYSVAISGETVAVGSLLDDTLAGVDAGSAYIFTRSGTSWIQRAKLTAPDGGPDDTFGTSIGVSGDTVIVGAPSKEVLGRVDAGTAYVFVRSGGLEGPWTQTAALVESDGTGNNYFGTSVALEGDLAVIGTYFLDPSAEVFYRTGGVSGPWTFKKHVLGAGVEFDDFFGYSVALSGTTFIVGSPRLDDATVGLRIGAAFVYDVTFPPPCPPDFNCSGTLEVADIFTFLNAWFAADPGADFNEVPGLQVGDIFTFLNLWFAGCP